MSSLPMRFPLGTPTGMRARFANALRSLWHGREIENHMLRACIDKLARDQSHKADRGQAPQRLKSVGR